VETLVAQAWIPSRIALTTLKTPNWSPVFKGLLEWCGMARRTTVLPFRHWTMESPRPAMAMRCASQTTSITPSLTSFGITCFCSARTSVTKSDMPSSYHS